MVSIPADILKTKQIAFGLGGIKGILKVENSATWALSEPSIKVTGPEIVGKYLQTNILIVL